MGKPTERFTNTVKDYIKYRPSYPDAVLSFLVKECHLTKESLVADMGSGTGLLTQLFLAFGMTVYGVEPNDAMREAGKTFLKDFPTFYSIKATAEQSTLPPHFFDLITAGTAFHWFDPVKAKQEFIRILKQEGYVALIWNVRDETFPLMKEYEALINEFGTDFKTSNASQFDHSVQEDFFLPHTIKIQSFPNKQCFDWQGLQGRLLSTSYAERPGDLRFEEMMKALKKIFVKYQLNNKIDFIYQTKVYCGQLN